MSELSDRVKVPEGYTVIKDDGYEVQWREGYDLAFEGVQEDDLTIEQRENRDFMRGFKEAKRTIGSVGRKAGMSSIRTGGKKSNSQISNER